MKDWALILGSSSGFGAATCKELAKRGIHIYGIHMDRKAGIDKVHNLVNSLQSKDVEVRFNNINAADSEKRKMVIDELKSIGDVRIKIFMHSLAFGTLKPIINIDAANAIQKRQVDMTLDVMCNSLIYWAQDLYKAGLLQKGSQIFAMTSSGGQRQWKTYGAVSAAKAGLESYCRQLALELSEFGIAANALQAGITDTPALRKIPGSKNMLENALRINPGKRITVAEDVAKSIALLGLSEESWLTGNTIRIDGGEDITG